MSSVLWLGLLLTVYQNANASNIKVENQIEHLGVMNGEVVGQNEVKIEQMLREPILFTADANKLSQELKSVIVKEAKLLNNQTEDVLFSIKKPLGSGKSITTHITVGLWLDGTKVKLIGKQSGNAVVFSIPPEHKLIDIRATRPIEMFLPREYKGDFNYNLDIEGLIH